MADKKADIARETVAAEVDRIAEAGGGRSRFSGMAVADKNVRETQV